MRWFIGHRTRTGQATGHRLPPSGTEVWNGPTALHCSGQWPANEARVLTAGDAAMAVFGPCFADQSRLVDDLARTMDDGFFQRLTRWPGAYTVLVATPTQVTILVDVAGQYPVFYREDSSEVLFSSRAALVAPSSTTEADQIWLAAQIACPGTPQATDGRSAYSGVRRLAGGRALTLTDTSVREWTYEPLAPDARATVGDAAPVLARALVESVRSRAEATEAVTADFSGGLDSTSIALLAASHVDGRLPAFTYDNPVAPAGDDLANARRFAALHSRLDHHVVTGGPATLAYQDLAAVTPTDEPNLDAANIARTRARLAAVTRAGSELHLTGDGGDIVLAAPYAYLADLTAPRHLRTLARHSRAWARLRFRPPTAVIAAAARTARQPHARALHELAGQLLHPPQAPVERQWEDTIALWARPGAAAAWLTTAARKHLAHHLHEQADRARPNPKLGAGDFVALSDLASYAIAHRMLREAADEHGVRLQAPFLDNQVIRASLQVPAFRRTDPYAPKPLLAHALRDQIPAAVFARRTKGDYSGEEFAGIRTARRTLRALFTDPVSAQIGLIEPDPVLQMLDQAALGLRVPFAVFNRLLAMELWLRHLHHVPLPPEAAHA